MESLILRDRVRNMSKSEVKKKKDKVVSVEEALSFIHDGCTLMFGGFGGIGNPPTIIDGILKKGVKRHKRLIKKLDMIIENVYIEYPKKKTKFGLKVYS